MTWQWGVGHKSDLKFKRHPMAICCPHSWCMGHLMWTFWRKWLCLTILSAPDSTIHSADSQNLAIPPSIIQFPGIPGKDIIAWGIHHNDVIMSAMVSQITSLTIVYSAIYSGADLRKHQSSVSLTFVRGIHRWPINSPHKGPVLRKMFPFHDVIMRCGYYRVKNLVNLIKAPRSLQPAAAYAGMNLFSKWCNLDEHQWYKFLWNVEENKTRATFETSNYPRRPYYRYTAPNSKCIGAEPPPPTPPQKKNE